MKKIKNIPDAPVILIFIMLLAVIMTWIIPGGEISYDSENDSGSTPNSSLCPTMHLNYGSCLL